MPRVRLTEASGKKMRLYVKLREYSFKVLKYAFYIRLGMEAYLFLLLSSVSETYYFNSSSAGEYVSQAFAIQLMILSLGVP